MRDTVTDDDHSAALETLARMDADLLKAVAEDILPGLGAVEVLESRTGLVLLPMRDTVQETDFHLGDVLVAEAHIRLSDHGAEGYGLIVGRDLDRAMAMALIDAARTAGLARDRISALLAAGAEGIARDEDAALRQIEATRVDMETF